MEPTRFDKVEVFRSPTICSLLTWAGILFSMLCVGRERRCPDWTHAAAPAHCTAESLSEELAQLRAYVSQSPQLELFQWRGIILRYKGPHLWAERHLPGSAKEEEGRMGAGLPYFYVDHDTEQTLYCSAGALVFD